MRAVLGCEPGESIWQGLRVGIRIDEADVFILSWLGPDYPGSSFVDLLQSVV